MKKILFLSILMLLPMLASADPIEIDGIYYNLDREAKTAEVTSRPNQYESDVAIPESVTYNVVVYSVTSIGDGAFRWCSGLTSVTIPNSVTFIGQWAFYNCSGLTSITIPSSVTSIGELAFSGCSGLTSVTIPNSVKTIGESAFNGCENLSSVTIANGVTSIGVAAFQLCTSLTSLTIPSSVTAIAEGAFEGCSGLQSIVVDKGNTVYDSREDCNAIIKTSDNELISGCTNSTIPNSVTKIGQSAFKNCKGLRSVRIPNSVVSVGQFAFQGCSGMTSITIPNSVTSIGSYAFQGCSGMTSITIPNSVTSIGSYAFRWCSGLTSITIPDGVSSIDEFVFYECSGLTSVTIPNSVTSIGDQAFSRCIGLTSVTIGSKVKTIGSLAFTDCLNLLDVYCYAEEVPETQNEVFRSANIENVTLHVPAASISAYQAVEPWKNFKEIVVAYHPFIEDDKVWAVRLADEEQTEEYFEYYYFDGDTIINGQTAKRMLYDRIGSNWDTIGEYIGAWYEQDKKVYYAGKGKQQFELLYDFTLSTGDIIQNHDRVLQVTKMSGSIPGFKGTYLDLQYINTAPIVERWLEGVGSQYYPWLNLCARWAGVGVGLLFCKAGDEIIYYNSEEEDPYSMGAKKHRFDFTHTIKTKPKAPSKREKSDARINSSEREVARPKVKARTREDNAETLYGEYNNQLLDIRLNPLDATYLVRITNESDQVVYEKTINAGSIVGLNIDISAFAKGRYTVTMENSGEVFTGEFETITTGIQELINEEETKNFNSSTLQFFNSIYNLQGQRLNRLQKGLNIVNGRKVFVK